MIGTTEAVQGTFDFSEALSGCGNGDSPVEVLANDGQGRAWLKLAEGWRPLAFIENLWELDAMETGGRSTVRMHFRAVTESGQVVRLFQDLGSGNWFQLRASVAAGV